MKSKPLTKFGKALMAASGFRICIVDDEAAYFTPAMLDFARNAGFRNIERHMKVDEKLFNDLQRDPRDIVILDVQGVVDPALAKDGVYVASCLIKNTPSFVAITSAHQYHLTNKLVEVDYVIENRLMTTVDFLDVLHDMVSYCLEKKLAPYRKIVFRLGYSICKNLV